MRTRLFQAFNRMAVLALVVSLLACDATDAIAKTGNKMAKRNTSMHRWQPDERALFQGLDEQAMRYFMENQLPNGLVLDRQSNFGPRRFDRAASISATGMGLIAISLASSPQHHMLTRAQAKARVERALLTSLKLKSDHGVMSHFVDPTNLTPIGVDQASTIDSAWLIAGALWSANYLGDSKLKDLADQLYDRVDWNYWSTTTASGGVEIVHGADATGSRLPGTWNRFNGETAFMYLLAIGARSGHSIPAKSWQTLPAVKGTVDGINFASADLGLFVSQYSSALIDFRRVPSLGQPDLEREGVKAAVANFVASRMASGQYQTYRHFWGLSAGDGPGANGDEYRAYAPGHDVDGTAQITATLASVDETPDLVLANAQAAESGLVPTLRGRYGYSNVNLDRGWVSQDVVGIDLGMAVMALENEFNDGAVRKLWHKLPATRRAIRRLKAVK